VGASRDCDELFPAYTCPLGTGNGMDNQDPLITSFVSSPTFADPLEEPTLTGPEDTALFNVKNTSLKRHSTNYGSDIAYSDLLAAGILSEQDIISRSQPVQTNDSTEFSDYGPDFDSDDERVIESLLQGIESESLEQSFAKEAAIQGSQDNGIPLAKVPRPISSQVSNSSKDNGNAIKFQASKAGLESQIPKIFRTFGLVVFVLLLTNSRD
jgi:hypothetical protein